MESSGEKERDWGEESREEEEEEIYRQPVEDGKPTTSHSFGPGGPILQLPAFTSGNIVLTPVIWGSFSHSFGP